MKTTFKTTSKISALILTILYSCSSSSGGSSPASVSPVVTSENLTNDVEFWLTKADQSVLLQKQTGTVGFSTTVNNFSNITVDESVTYQTIDGFGYTLTGASAQVINELTPAKKQELLQELFGTTPTSIAISYLRLSIGASDLNATPFTYNDSPTGDTDVNQTKFSLNKDKLGVIALLKEILAINPNLKLLATPWSAPAWMKSNNSLKGGSLKTEYYASYAQYFVKYIQEMKKEGITIDAITPQNEPENPNNNPSMTMTAQEQTNFIKNNLGPDFKNAGINTKIVTFDHNCDNPNYPIAILNDALANPFVDGSAFHLYAGDIGALSTVHHAHPNKNIYFTEQWTQSTGSFAADLKWHLKNVIIGSMLNYSKIALEWNLANDGSFGPHTDGGCFDCKGAITINSTEAYVRNVGYYNIAHASKFVPAGSKRIASSLVDKLNNVAFLTPNGKRVLIVANEGDTKATFNIKHNNKWAKTALDAGAVATYIW
jgi:glucosylceramidase